MEYFSKHIQSNQYAYLTRLKPFLHWTNNPLTFGLCFQWERVQSAFILGSNDPVIVTGRDGYMTHQYSAIFRHNALMCVQILSYLGIFRVYGNVHQGSCFVHYKMQQWQDGIVRELLIRWGRGNKLIGHQQKPSEHIYTGSSKKKSGSGKQRTWSTFLNTTLHHRIQNFYLGLSQGQIDILQILLLSLKVFAHFKRIL